jgi:hypothetical protein
MIIDDFDDSQSAQRQTSINDPEYFGELAERLRQRYVNIFK